MVRDAADRGLSSALRSPARLLLRARGAYRPMATGWGSTNTGKQLADEARPAVIKSYIAWSRQRVLEGFPGSSVCPSACRHESEAGEDVNGSV